MSKKILVIDDDEGILEGFEAILDSAGYEVQTSADVEKALKITKKDMPDLILLDVLLSGTDGREICKAIKTNTVSKNIPVIMVSAHPGVKKSIMEAGADDYLSKPFEMDDLLQKVKKHLTTL